MRTLLVVSDDYWGARAVSSITDRPDVLVAVDRSGGLLRALKLVFRRSVPIRAAAHIWLAGRRLPREKPKADRTFIDNSGLRTLAEHEDVRNIILFRAGLIISGKTLEQCHVRNIHCADIHGFGGLASIHRALKAGAFNQKATLHTVTNRIDKGEVLDTELFELDPNLGYAANEARAYEAGLRLLFRTLNSRPSAQEAS